MKDKLISVVVPAYNVEKTISKCLNSIIYQTYKNIEIIVVDDGSTDKTNSIVADYCKRYSQIKLYEHKKNKGLYATRITGVKKAKGEYIGFVDSDDYISKDYYRELIMEAEKQNADIVVAKLVQENQTGYQWVQNIYEDYSFGVKNNDEIWNSYWEQEGQLFIWHTVWNKLYSVRLWKEALPILENYQNHLIMAEDFMFSSVLFYYAKKLSGIKYARYFYYRNDKASTSLNNDVAKYEKNIKDLTEAFKFVKKFLNNVKISEQIMTHYNRWEGLYKFFWTQNVINSTLAERDKTRFISLLNQEMKSDEIPSCPNYFYSVETKFDGRYEEIVQRITQEGTRIVSFDIFDTALIRPFYSPTDLFELLNIEFEKNGKERGVKFSVMRKEAEKSIRKKKIYESATPVEEVGIKEIYDEIEKIFHVDSCLLKKMMSNEIAAEKKFLSRRESVYNLYKIACYCGKRVVFSSDMYIDGNTLGDFLKRNGYNWFDNIFVSVDQKVSKRTGKLFELIKEQYASDGSDIVHIGDSWELDFINARKCGIDAKFYPKTLECLEYGISDIKSTHALSNYKGRNNSLINFEFGLKYLGNRCAIAIAANKLYDMPFYSYDEWSEMNASPQFMGEFAVGMHLLGFTKWINEKSKEKGYKQLAFIARDGYLPMKAYQILSKYDTNSIKNIVYFYTSRKAAIPCGIKKIEDLYWVYEEIEGKLEKKEIINYLRPILDEQVIKERHLDEIEQEIGTIDDWYSFVEEDLKPAFDKAKADKFNENVCTYINNLIIDKSAIVDIGYSGRTQEMISRTTGKQVDAFYVHKNDDKCNMRENKYGFFVNTFYEFTPSITGAQREILFSSLEPSCIGYKDNDEGFIPVFETKEYEYPYKYLINEIQNSALDFVESYCKYFGNVMNAMSMRNIEISYPYEQMLAFLKKDDMHVFDCVLFEDDLWAGKTISLPDQWDANISYHRLLPFYETKTEICYIDKISDIDNVPTAWKLYNEMGIAEKNTLKKFVFWLVNDKAFLKKRIREKVKNKGTYK